MRRSRRAARAVASLPTMTAAASRRSCARRRCPNRPATDLWKAAGQLPGGQVEQRGHDRQARGDRQRAAADGVIDRARRAATLGPPGRTDGRAAQQERVDGHRPGPQQAGRWQLAAPDDLEVLVARRSGRRGPIRSGTRRIRRPAAPHRRRRAARRGRQRRAAPARVPGAAGHRARPGDRGPPARRPRQDGSRARPVTAASTCASAGRSPRPAAGRRRPAPRPRSAGSSWTAPRVGRGT